MSIRDYINIVEHLEKRGTGSDSHISVAINDILDILQTISMKRAVDVPNATLQDIDAVFGMIDTTLSFEYSVANNGTEKDRKLFISADNLKPKVDQYNRNFDISKMYDHKLNAIKFEIQRT